MRSIVFDEKALSQKGAVFEVVKFPPRTSNKPHFHKKTSEIFYIRKGCGFVNINSAKYAVKQDDILFVSPEQKHQVTNASEQEMTILVFKINGNDNDTYW